MKKSLVTGAAGFAGRHLIHRLLDLGHEVHAVDSLAPLTGAIDPEASWPLFEPRDYRAFRFYRLDCREWFLRSRDPDFDYAYHLAAMVGGRLMIENNPLAVADDLSIDAAFWQWAKETRPAKSVYFSSSAAYPIRYQQRESHTLLKEEMVSFERDIGMPDMTYGWAKLTAEYLARLAFKRHGLRSVVYRPFSGYGEDQDDAYPFPAICKRILRSVGASEVRVWGTGQQMRDFIHIDDCIEGVLRTVDRIDDAGAVNLSTGVLTSFIDFARQAAQIVGYNPVIKGSPDKPEGVFARGGDTQRQLSLGIGPRISLPEGMERAFRFYRSR